MSGFLPKEPNTFINIKLTDAGRRLLSLGRLTFDKAALSDREINYGFNRQTINGYDIQNNRVIAPKDNHPTFSNFDGSDNSIIFSMDSPLSWNSLYLPFFVVTVWYSTNKTH